MNAKGYFVLKKFIKKFGANSIEYIVSSEDKNIKKDYFNDIEKLALTHEIQFFKRIDTFNMIEESFNGKKFVIGWRWIIKNNNNLIVFHDSLLPKYRGFAPLVNTLVDGKKKAGVTALLASEEYDKGDILLQKDFRIKYPIQIDTIIDMTKPLYWDLVKSIYTKIISNKKLKTRKQDDSKATYSLWLDQEDYFIDWNWNAKKIKRFVDAVSYPYDYAKAYLNGTVVKFVSVEVVEDVAIQHRSRHTGKVIFLNNKPVLVCKRGLLQLNEIRDEKESHITINFRSRFK